MHLQRPNARNSGQGRVGVVAVKAAKSRARRNSRRKQVRAGQACARRVSKPKKSWAAACWGAIWIAREVSAVRWCEVSGKARLSRGMIWSVVVQRVSEVSFLQPIRSLSVVVVL